MSETRLERDSMGELAVPADALYGAQTQRAVENFPVSGLRMPVPFIRSLILAKAAAARANVDLEQLGPAIGDAIVGACQQLLEGDFIQHFPVDVFQTGSGTSTNMNANEVIATLASNRLGEPVSPNDHVNCGQSSNDIIPTTITSVPCWSSANSCCRRSATCCRRCARNPWRCSPTSRPAAPT